MEILRHYVDRRYVLKGRRPGQGAWRRGGAWKTAAAGSSETASGACEGMGDQSVGEGSILG